MLLQSIIRITCDFGGYVRPTIAKIANFVCNKFNIIIITYHHYEIRNLFNLFHNVVRGNQNGSYAWNRQRGHLPLKLYKALMKKVAVIKAR